MSFSYSNLTLRNCYPENFVLPGKLLHHGLLVEELQSNLYHWGIHGALT